MHGTRLNSTIYCIFITTTSSLPSFPPLPPSFPTLLPLSSEIMVDRQLTQTSQELAHAKQTLEQKDSLIQHLREQIDQMDSEIQDLQTTMNHRQQHTQTPASSIDFDKEENSWYL